MRHVVPSRYDMDKPGLRLGVDVPGSGGGYVAGASPGHLRLAWDLVQGTTVARMMSCRC